MVGDRSVSCRVTGDEFSEAIIDQIIPVPKCAVSVRVATMDDLPFIDHLQKKHTKQVGFMPTKALEGKVRAGHVLVAEERSEVRDQKSAGENLPSDVCPLTSSSLTSDLRPLTLLPVGYCIGNDQYFKRDDVGIIYQMNVVPGRQRGFVGATLLKAMFERSAYGCRLYCCWCAQDLEANRFWESLGFVPAFPHGSRGKGRVHIFWQRRIREGDEGQGGTPWWFPSQTGGGSIREDRLVLPIPPGKHWSDAKPIILPGKEELRNSGGSTRCASSQPELEEEATGVAGSEAVEGIAGEEADDDRGGWVEVWDSERDRLGKSETETREETEDEKRSRG